MSDPTPGTPDHNWPVRYPVTHEVYDQILNRGFDIVRDPETNEPLALIRDIPNATEEELGIALTSLKHLEEKGVKAVPRLAFKDERGLF